MSRFSFFMVSLVTSATSAVACGGAAGRPAEPSGETRSQNSSAATNDGNSRSAMQSQNLVTARLPQPASSLATPPASTPAPPQANVSLPITDCSLRCVGSGEDTRLTLQGGAIFRFQLLDKTVGSLDELHILSEAQNNNIMLVENSSAGDAFSLKNDQVKVCSKLHGTGGSCSWYCALDADLSHVKFSTDQLAATFKYTCR